MPKPRNLFMLLLKVRRVGAIHEQDLPVEAANVLHYKSLLPLKDRGPWAKTLGQRTEPVHTLLGLYPSTP